MNPFRLSRIAAAAILAALPACAAGPQGTGPAQPVTASPGPATGSGLAQAPAVPEREWIGRRLVRLGEADPGGNVVREADLPEPYRIFDPEHQIGDMMYSPARLDITVDAAGIITDVRRG